VTLKIPSGARVFLGAPAQPLEESSVEAITDVVESVPEIVEAHLPQCYVPKAMSKAAQVLVIVVSPGHVERTAATVVERISAVLSPGALLDVWPVAVDSALLGAIRGAECKIFDRSGETSS
jgi:hypothetical protein